MGMSPRLLRPRASGSFKPTQLAGLEMWFDAADSTSITLNGGNVSQWQDKSGNGRHATQATAANQPSYSSTQQNGKGGIYFELSKWLTTSGNAFTIAQPVTFFVVFNTPETSGFSWSVFDGTSQRIVLYGDNNYSAYMFAGQGLYMDVSPNAPNVAVLTYSGASSKYAINSKTQTAGGSSAGTNSLSNQLKIGANIGNGAQLQSYIFELGLYSQALSAADASTVAQYLSKKWAVAIS